MFALACASPCIVQRRVHRNAREPRECIRIRRRSCTRKRGTCARLPSRTRSNAHDCPVVAFSRANDCEIERFPRFFSLFRRSHPLRGTAASRHSSSRNSSAERVPRRSIMSPGCSHRPPSSIYLTVMVGTFSEDTWVTREGKKPGVYHYKQKI